MQKMADEHETNLIQSIGDNEIPRKRQKFKEEEEKEEMSGALSTTQIATEEKKDESIEEPAEPFQITDLIDNCLLDIFDYLSLVDLLNVVDTNNRMKKLAATVFKRKCASKTLQIEGIQSHSKRNIEIKPFELLVVKDLKSYMQIMRCFGHLFHKVNLNFSKINASFCTTIGHYLAMYGSKTLKQLTLRKYSSVLYTSNFPFNGTETPFVGVDSLVIDHCSFRTEFPFNELFPNMLELKLYENQFLIPKIIEKQFNRLECVTLENKPGFNMEMFFFLNPQLNTLKLYPDYDPELIWYINDRLRNLEKLELYDLPDAFFDDKLIIEMDNVTSLSLYVSVKTRYSLGIALPSILKAIPFTFNKLENLSIQNLSLNQKTLDSLAKMGHLNELRLYNYKDEGNFIERLLRLKNILKNVTKLNIAYGIGIGIPNRCILRFLEQSEAINDFSFPAGAKALDDIKWRLGPKWKIYFQLENIMYIARSGQHSTNSS